MKFCVLASGSRGNMTYLETEKSKILIDAGITITAASSRCKSIDFSKITDIFITHYHTDHVKFLRTVMMKTNAKLYIHRNCYKHLEADVKAELKKHSVYFIEENCRYEIDDFVVYTLLLSHDTESTLGYIFESGGIKLTYITDTGILFDKYLEDLQNSDVLIIESNHSVEALLASTRDWRLKQRILSDVGHLSNQKCCEVLHSIANTLHGYVVLAHISEECNSIEAINEEVILQIKNEFSGEILVAKQNEAIGLIEI